MKSILKKIISFVLIALSVNSVFLLTACNNDNDQQEKGTKTIENNIPNNEPKQNNEPEQNIENKKMGEISINSNVDIKIININADVYGESAIYTQFLGSDGSKGIAPNFAKKITPSNDLTENGYKNHQDYENGYLLYAIGIGGYNNGQAWQAGNFYNGCGCKCCTNNAGVYVNNEFGYNKYIQKVNNNFLATKYAKPNKTIKPNNFSICDEGEYPYTNSYTIDKTTKTAQIVYMYTINQWKADGTNNAILGKLTASQTESLGDNGLGVINVETNLYIGKLKNYDTKVTNWTKMTFNSLGESYFELKSTNQGGEDIEHTYYILLTFTVVFEQDNKNFELLNKTISHNLKLGTNDEREQDKDYVVIEEGSDFVYMASNSSLDENGNIKIEGELFNPDTSKIKNQVVGSFSQEKLKNNFALDSEVEGNNKITFLPTGEYGFIY